MFYPCDIQYTKLSYIIEFHLYQKLVHNLEHYVLKNSKLILVGGDADVGICVVEWTRDILL